MQPAPLVSVHPILLISQGCFYVLLHILDSLAYCVFSLQSSLEGWLSEVSAVFEYLIQPLSDYQVL